MKKDPSSDVRVFCFLEILHFDKSCQYLKSPYIKTQNFYYF